LKQHPNYRLNYISIGLAAKGVYRKISRGEGATKKRPKKTKKKTKNSTIKPLPGGPTEKKPEK